MSWKIPKRNPQKRADLVLKRNKFAFLLKLYIITEDLHDISVIDPQSFSKFRICLPKFQLPVSIWKWPSTTRAYNIMSNVHSMPRL